MILVSLIFIVLASSQYADDDFESDLLLTEDEKPLSSTLEPPIETVKPNFHMEIGMLGFLALFFVNLYVGKKKNESLAKDWLYLLKPLFQENFSHTGAADNEGEGEMLKEAYHVFKYYATGRYNLGYILGTLELCKRQDFLSSNFFGPLTKECDKIAYDIPIKQESPNPVTLMICRTSQLKSKRLNHNDIKTLTKVIDTGLPAQYTVLAESQEVSDFIVNSNVIKLIMSLGNSIEFIYITDQAPLIEGYGLSLTSSFLHPSRREEVGFISFQAQLVILMADLTSKLNLSLKARTTAEKERVLMNKEKQKEIKQQRDDERLQKKYEQKKKEEEKIQNLTKEQKRKYEEKEHKKELKKKGLKFKMIKA